MREFVLTTITGDPMEPSSGGTSAPGQMRLPDPSLIMRLALEGSAVRILLAIIRMENAKTQAGPEKLARREG